MRRALSSNRLPAFSRGSRASLGAPLAVSPATSTYTRHRWATPAQPCSLHGDPLLRRFQHTGTSHTETSPAETSPPAEISIDKPIARRLPLQCTGCGAFTQTADATQAGYFNLQRKGVQEFLGLLEPKAPRTDEVPEAEDKVVEEALGNLTPEQLEALGLSKDDLIATKEDKAAQKPPIQGMPNI